MDNKIQAEAKAILDKFAKALDKAPAPKPQKSQSSETTRQETQVSCDPNLKKRILTNAPRKDQDHILAEKANW